MSVQIVHYIVSFIWKKNSLLSLNWKASLRIGCILNLILLIFSLNWFVEESSLNILLISLQRDWLCFYEFVSFECCLWLLNLTVKHKKVLFLFLSSKVITNCFEKHKKAGATFLKPLVLFIVVVGFSFH